MFKSCPELYFVKAGPGPYPGLLDMWGGGGNLIEYRSALLASRGYASMALAYINPEEQQSTEITSSYFEVCVFSLKLSPQVQTFNRPIAVGARLRHLVVKCKTL